MTISTTPGANITALGRYFVGDPSIVSIVCTNTLTNITTTGYLTNQYIEADIELIQNGDFEWTATDLVLIYYATAQIGFFTYDATNQCFDALAPSGGLSNTLQNGDIFVGNASNLATDVTPSGDITLSNTGVFGIATGVIVNSDVNASAAIDFSKLAALTSAHILVGSAGNVATNVAMSGDIAITNTGVTTIQAGAVTNAKVNAAAAIDFSKLATLTSGNILVGSAGNVATSVAMSGDATIIASGALTLGNNVVTSAKTAKTLLQYVAVSLTAAEFKALYDTPKLLVAAAGANTLLVVERCILAMTFVAAQYTAGGAVAVQYDSTVHGAGVLASGTVAAATINADAASASQMLVGALADGPFSTTVNKGLYLSNATADFATGDSTFVAHVWYKVIPTV